MPSSFHSPTPGFSVNGVRNQQGPGGRADPGDHVEEAGTCCWVWQSVSRAVRPPSVTGLELALAPNIQSEVLG